MAISRILYFCTFPETVLIARHTVAEGRTEIGSDASNSIKLPDRARVPPGLSHHRVVQGGIKPVSRQKMV
jgi:hypothetical protein